MDPIAHRPMTIPNPPMHMPSTPNFPPEMQCNNGGPSNKSHIVHSMDVSCLLQKDMSPPGPSGIGAGAYGYHPSSITPTISQPALPTILPRHITSSTIPSRKPIRLLPSLRTLPTHELPSNLFNTTIPRSAALHAAVSSSSSPPPTAA